MNQDDIFSNYSHSQIHLDMIQDEPRTLAYYNSIEKNASFFKDKVVADVGSGTGILSLFAARVGAKKVYAIECTPIHKLAEKIIKDNNFENIITVVVGRSEEIQLPEKVDIIISEWMGYSLYFEVMLPAVLSIRDRFLKPNGLILPSSARLFISAVEVAEYRATSVDYWDSVYGLNFSAMKEFSIKEPVIESVYPSQLLSAASIISEIDISKCQSSCQFFTSPFKLYINRFDLFDGFITWFDVDFNGPISKSRLSTSPFDKSTHWAQTVFLLPQPIEVKKGDIFIGTIQTLPHPDDQGGMCFIIKYRLNNDEEKSLFYQLT